MSDKSHPPILGAGIIHGSVPLRGQYPYTDFDTVDNELGIELQFYSNSGELVAIIGTDYDDSELVKLEIELEKIGELKKFKFSSSRLINRPFFNDMEVRFFNRGEHKYTGLLTIQPGQGQSEENFEFEGKGFVDYAKRINVEKLYIDETVEDIIIDLVSELVDESKVLYNPSLIDIDVAENVTVPRMQLKDKTIEKGLDEMLEIVNSITADKQYRYGVNHLKEFFFAPIDEDVEYGFQEGYQFQEAKIEQDISSLINVVLVFRAIQNSQEVEYVSTHTDNESIDKWGRKEHKIIISDFVDSTTAGRIANAIIEKYKDPIETVEITNIEAEEMEYDFHRALVLTRWNNYVKEVSDFERITGVWDVTNISNTTVSLSSTRTISNKNCFKCETAAGSEDEYIEVELEEEVYFVEKIIIYTNISIAGNLFLISAFDEAGNEEVYGARDVAATVKITEDGFTKITEGGDRKITEDDSGVIGEGFKLNYAGDYYRLEIAVRALNDIKKIRITFLINTVATILFDRLDFQTFSTKGIKSYIETIKYVYEKNGIACDMTLGGEVPNLIKDLKKLDKKSENILNIFQKG